MALEGSFSDTRLVELLQILGLSSKTGLLLVQRNDDRGRYARIYLVHGEIVHAEYFSSRSANRPQFGGREAVFSVMAWDDEQAGQFRVEADVTPKYHTINEGTTNLLLEGSRRLDEWKDLQRNLPLSVGTFQLQPVDARPAPGAHIHLPPSAWRILAAIEPGTDIAGIADAAGVSHFEALRTIAQLLALGLIEHSDGKPKPAATKNPAVTTTPQPEKQKAPPLSSRGAEVEFYSPAPVPAPAQEPGTTPLHSSPLPGITTPIERTSSPAPERIIETPAPAEKLASSVIPDSSSEILPGSRRQVLAMPDTQELASPITHVLPEQDQPVSAGSRRQLLPQPPDD